MFFDTIFAIFRAFVAHKMQLQYYNDFPKYATLIQKFFKKFSTKKSYLIHFQSYNFSEYTKSCPKQKTNFIHKIQQSKTPYNIYRFSHYIGFYILFMRHYCSIGQ